MSKRRGETSYITERQIIAAKTILQCIKIDRETYNPTTTNTYPQCTHIDSRMSKESFLCFKVGYPPKSEPPNSPSLLRFSSYVNVKFLSTGDGEGDFGMSLMASSTGR